jgi:hypothetical protein
MPHCNTFASPLVPEYSVADQTFVLPTWVHHRAAMGK